MFKIDRTFISGLARDQHDWAVLPTIAALGENFGPTLLVEGVETSEQWRVLHGLGCAWAQGYLFARPMPPGELTS